MLRLLSLAVLVAFVATVAPFVTDARGQGSRAARRAQTAIDEARSARRKQLDELVRSIEDYKKSLGELVALRESSLRKLETDVAKRRELYAAGLIARRDIEAADAELAAARSKIEDARTQITNADNLIAEAVVPEEPEPYSAPPLSASRTAGSAVARFLKLREVAYFYSPGRGSWSLARAGEIQGFFRARFNRSLPISAFGQTATHNRLGFSHANAVDVPLHPDSIEGRALIEFLIGRDIPFFAFRRAVSGSATGAHIHVGARSRRIAVRPG